MTEKMVLLTILLAPLAMPALAADPEQSAILARRQRESAANRMPRVVWVPARVMAAALAAAPSTLQMAHLAPGRARWVSRAA